MIRDIDVGVARAFLTVVEAGGVTKAAGVLRLSQGAVSQQIKRLEELHRAPLFARRGRKLILTADGERLIDLAQRLVSANDEMWSAMRQPAFEGEVKFGVPYDIMGSYMPPILRRIGRALPRVRVTLVCKDTLLLLDDLGSGKLDLALTTELACGAGGATVRRDRLVWVGARGGDAYARDPLPVSLGAPSCVFRPVTVEALRKKGRRWRAVCEVSNMEPVRATIEADLAVATLLEHSVPDSLDILRAEARLPPLPVFRINLYQAPRLGPAARQFAEQARLSIAANVSARGAA